MKKNPNQARQGDVFLEKVTSLPEGAKKQAKDARGRVVLAYGEVTGHAHAIVSDLVEPYVADGVLYVKADGTVELRHEEHGTIELTKGIWKKAIPQREYTPEEIRDVRD